VHLGFYSRRTSRRKQESLWIGCPQGSGGSGHASEGFLPGFGPGVAPAERGRAAPIPNHPSRCSLLLDSLRQCSRAFGASAANPHADRFAVQRRVEQVEHRVQMLLGIFAVHGVLPLEFKPADSVGQFLV
jgi:hypothetical protein